MDNNLKYYLFHKSLTIYYLFNEHKSLKLNNNVYFYCLRTFLIIQI